MEPKSRFLSLFEYHNENIGDLIYVMYHVRFVYFEHLNFS